MQYKMVLLKIKNIDDKIPDISNLATNTSVNGKINESKGEIPSITNLATTATLTNIENKIPNFINLVKKLTKTQKLMKLKRKLLIMIMANILLLQNLILKNIQLQDQHKQVQQA